MNQHLRPDPVPFIDIAAQRRRLGRSVDEAVSRVLAHCQFINGPEVTELEAALAAFSGAKHVVTCASGTDALLMVLMAKGVGRGDAVLCPSFTFCATGEAVALTGATPVFVDVDEATFNMDVASLKRGIATAKRLGLKPKGVIPVDLFGQSADHDAIGRSRTPKGMFVLDDAAQAFGASYKGRRLGGLGLHHRDQFLPGQAARLLWRRRGDFHRRRRIRRNAAQRPRPRPGLGQIRQCPSRADRAARHHSGGGADRKAEDLRRRNRGAQHASPERYAQGLGNVVTVPRLASRAHLGLGAIHHPPAGRAPTAMNSRRH